jgi:hypothetical protein
VDLTGVNKRAWGGFLGRHYGRLPYAISRISPEIRIYQCGTFTQAARFKGHISKYGKRWYSKLVGEEGTPRIGILLAQSKIASGQRSARSSMDGSQIIGSYSMK